MRPIRGRPADSSSEALEEAQHHEQRLVLSAAARIATQGDAVEVVIPWRPGLTTEIARAAVHAGAHMWIRRSGASLVARFAPTDAEREGTFAGLGPA
ncbi:MAG: hypothetical protein M3O93_05545 [Chloroflexota bacterium]|nr:hypothetical protein [Chloroflexota bacterium]